jgi:hypothetical protein
VSYDGQAGQAVDDLLIASQFRTLPQTIENQHIFQLAQWLTIPRNPQSYNQLQLDSLIIVRLRSSNFAVTGRRDSLRSVSNDGLPSARLRSFGTTTWQTSLSCEGWLAEAPSLKLRRPRAEALARERSLVGTYRGTWDEKSFVNIQFSPRCFLLKINT